MERRSLRLAVITPGSVPPCLPGMQPHRFNLTFRELLEQYCKLIHAFFFIKYIRM